MVRPRPKELELPLFYTRRFLTITELNDAIKGTLDGRLGALWVVGEISNFRVPPSGHFYFTLKDDKCQIGAVMFRKQGNGLAFAPEDGMEVLCCGRVSLYPARGDLQFYVEDMEPRGQGALAVAFEQLKRKLAVEGLFAAERKKPLPFLPASIGIVTSLKGAALYDMLRMMKDRFRNRRIVIRPVRVQGDGSGAEIAAGIVELAHSGEIDVLIVGRGGGSLEDLWAFNEEAVARAIAASPVPVISAVGHEIDFTIADLVADHRAPTPTAAAEMVVPREADLVQHIAGLEQAMLKCMRAKLGSYSDSFRRLVGRLSDPGRKLRDHQQRLDDLSIDLLTCFNKHVRQLKAQVAHAAGRLHALSPLAVLDRGYSLVHKLPEESLVKDAASLHEGDRLRVTFARGRSIVRVEAKE